MGNMGEIGGVGNDGGQSAFCGDVVVEGMSIIALCVVLGEDTNMRIGFRGTVE